jgi:hypothetical protein
VTDHQSALFSCVLQEDGSFMLLYFDQGSWRVNCRYNFADDGLPNDRSLVGWRLPELFFFNF